MPYLLLVALSLFAARFAVASAPPHPGGTLRIELRARVASLDPREWPADANEAAAADKLESLIYERLVRLDENGRLQPALAISWQHDAEAKRWEFHLRPGVVLHDGTPLTSAIAAAAWLRVNDLAPIPVVEGDALVLQSEHPVPDLPVQLARGRNFIFRVGGDGSAIGTGPFKPMDWRPGRRLVLAANENHWAGRPFLDSITIEMGVAPKLQLIDLELGKTDLAELLPDQIRRAAQSGLRTWSSAPVELLALEFEASRPAVQDRRLRQALSLAMDRNAIWSVLLQRQGEVAASLLPQWLSGYAFLFRTEPDMTMAKELRSALPATAPLVLVYDSADMLARSIAERIALNARDAGFAIQVSAAGPASKTAADIRLVRRRLGATDSRAALAELAAPFGMSDAAGIEFGATPEQLYVAERSLLETYRVVPLAYLPESYGLSAHLKNWMPLRWGAWRLEDAWLEAPAAAAATGGKP